MKSIVVCALVWPCPVSVARYGATVEATGTVAGDLRFESIEGSPRRVFGSAEPAGRSNR